MSTNNFSERFLKFMALFQGRPSMEQSQKIFGSTPDGPSKKNEGKRPMKKILGAPVLGHPFWSFVGCLRATKRQPQ